jgi:hypothetical protein
MHECGAPAAFLPHSGYWKCKGCTASFSIIQVIISEVIRPYPPMPYGVVAAWVISDEDPVWPEVGVWNTWSLAPPQREWSVKRVTPEEDYCEFE